MALLDPLRRFVLRRVQRDVDTMRDQTDAALDEIERQGTGYQITDAEWADMTSRMAKLEAAGMATERDRTRLARIARLAGRGGIVG